MAPQNKHKIPIEILNAREWDPSRAGQDLSDSDSTNLSDVEDEATDSSKISPLPERGPTEENVPPNNSQAGQASPQNSSRNYLKKPVRSQRSTNHPKHQPYKGRLRYIQDNLAKAAHRKHVPATGSLPLHRSIFELEPDVGRLEHFLAEIGVRLQTYIPLPAASRGRNLEIWGRKLHVDKTKLELQAWVKTRDRNKPSNSRGKDKFAKERSTRSSIFKGVDRKVELQQYKREPRPDASFRYCGVYLWSSDVSPQTILGGNLEAFDELRTRYRSHIVYNSVEQIIKVYSNKDASVQPILVRIEGTLKEFHARSLQHGRTNRIYMYEPPNPQNARREVKLHPSQPEKDVTGNSFIPTLAGRGLDADECHGWPQHIEDFSESNAGWLQESLEGILPALRHFRGRLIMRLICGTYALTEFRRIGDAPSISYKDLLGILQHPGTRGTLLRNLHLNKSSEQVLSHLNSCQEILRPIGSSNTSIDTAIYGARFEIPRFGRSPAQYMIEMRREQSGGQGYERWNAFWSRTGNKDRCTSLDAFMIRLGGRGGVTSWKMQVFIEGVMDPSQIDPNMASFADRVKMLPAAELGVGLNGERVFTWEREAPGFLRPSSFEQKTAVRYNLVKMPGWVLELARYDSYNLSPKQSQAPIDTSWGANLYNTDWEFLFGENQNLGIGEMAHWDTKLRSFFPSSTPYTGGVDPGVKEFLKNVQDVMSCLDALRELPPHVSG